MKKRYSYKYFHFFLFFISFFFVQVLSAQVAGDYRSRNLGSNNWSDASKWERYNGAAWIANPAEGYPGQTAVAGEVTIRALRSMVLDVTPANNIGALSVNAIAALTVSGDRSITINGNLNIGIAGSVTFSGTGNFSVGGTTTLSAAGSFTDNNGTGSTTFTGGITLNAGANWTSTAITTTGNLIFKGGIVNSSATFSAGGATFDTNPQALSGTLSFANAVTVTGITVTNNGTVTMSNTAAGTLTGTGSWVQGAAGSLIYAGSTVTVASFNASAAGNTINYNSSVPQNIPGVTYSNLVLNNSSGTIPQLTLAGNLNVSNTLTMTQGIVNLSGNTLTLGSGGGASVLVRTASTTTNWMYGGTFTRHWLSGTPITSNSGNYYGLFPMGESTAASYSPLEINTSVNPTANGSFSVGYIPDPFNGTDLSPLYNDGGTNVEHILNSSFVTAVSGVTGGTYNVDVTMTGVNPTGALSDMRLVLSTGGTTASAVGTHAAATGTVVNPTVHRTGLSITDLSAKDFRIGTANKGSTPLPVEFLSFDAIPQGGIVDLIWSTAAEFNSDYFIVQRSLDGNNFESIIYMEAAGNSSSVKKYYTSDADPYPGISFYRLKQIDNDGKFIYSNVVAVSISQDEGVSIFPNPSHGSFSVSVSGSHGENSSLTIMDILGNEIYATSITDNIMLSVGPSLRMAPGIYFISVRTAKANLTQKLIIK